MADSLQQQPLVSICVPTYNRAHFLTHMLQCMQEVRNVCGDQVEFCISNNCSPDSTAELVAEWTPKLNLRSVTQAENIGSTRNIIAVTRLARGRWIHVVGDDDTIYAENYRRLLEDLRAAHPETWVLTEVCTAGSCGINLLGLKDGTSSVRAFRWTTIRTGLVRYGFIGQHIIPACHLEAFDALPVEAFNLWAHIGLMLRHLGREGSVLVCRAPVVQQAGGGAGLFWRADDWAKLQLCRWIIVHYAKNEGGRLSWFFNALLLREIYGVDGIKIPISWKLHEPETYNERALGVYWQVCRGLGKALLLAAPFFVLILTLRVVSMKIFDYSPFRSYVRKVRQRYINEKEKLSKFDGMKREGNRVGAAR